MQQSSNTAARNDAGMADCAREPIHIPGGIQPHGYLFAIDEAGTIVQASANVAELAGGEVQSVLGKPLQDVLGDAAAAVLQALHLPESAGTPFYVGSIEARRNGALAAMAVLVHRHADVAIVELEPAHGAIDVFRSMYPMVRAFIESLQGASTVEELARLAVHEVHRIAGFGRTMAYCFDAAGTGRVIAEVVEPGYDSYMHHHFPGSDIPQQARALYVLNRIRLIADANYRAAPLVPPVHPVTGRPTDLTYSSLRSISPVHVQYMKNMGTLASMSMSIVVKGRLWGLISCHHAEPRLPPFEARSACEHIAQVLSLQIEAKEEHAEAAYRLLLRERLSRLLAAMANAEDFVDALAGETDNLLALTAARGAAVVFEGRIVRIGATPGQPVIERLVKWLDTRDEDVYCTDNLASLWNAEAGDTASASGSEPDPDSAGILALSISRLYRNYVIWFRPETVRTIEWAGDPGQKLAGQASTLSPRSSFETWVETVRNRSKPWRPAEIEIAQEFRGALLGIVLRRAEEMAQLAMDLTRVNRELEGFSYTVSHDLRAPLRHIVGFADLLREMEWARLSERGRHFVERITSQARFGGKLVDDLLAFSRMSRAALHPQRVDMDALVRRLIAEEGRDAAHPIDWQVAELGTVTADPLLMEIVMRNLVANAVKFTGPGPDGAAPPAARIHIGRSPGEGQLAGQDVFFVRDNGVGFDMRYADKLFGVFQRLHRNEEFPGTGIGLASVRRIVERHGGKTWASGEVGKGATISFSLPQAYSPQQVDRETSASETAARIAAVSATQSYKPVLKDTKKEGER
ncbi:ATP-binding protein [Cupriavidus sp. AU9028]|uniref:ATP-binding protein n=1 Tax=Cupriavidus sp. AU9028 TaxID=2871157 RepID=UPI001C97652D|nr:ATP-binding protein [Cupriavidus sp. AU9028]MBY4899203.1 GAF domain-containing protein [Cupriavidus sp. AU9028]